ncbi:MAG: thioredoxin fold domain-containing protein, partial [Thiomonas sp.]
SGKRALFIFFDPNCPFCHELYKKLRAFVGQDDVQFRWIPLGMLTASSLPKAAAILQAPDPLKAFDKNENDYDFAANGQPGGGIEPATTIVSKVREALAANLALYNSQKLFGVPVVIWRKADGRADMLIGVPSDAQIQTILKEMR